MPLDRWGNPIRIAFSAKECLWILAALEIPRAERNSAFMDIAEMTGRDFVSIRAKAYSLHAEYLATWTAPRREIMVPDRDQRIGCPYLPPSELKPVSEAQKRAGRAR